jgi:hypothetical protein
MSAAASAGRCLRATPEPRLERDVLVRLEEERVEEEHAELAVALPRLARCERLERPDVDGRRAALPRHWTLYEVASFRVRSSARARSSRSSWRSAASFSIEKGHSYG